MDEVQQLMQDESLPNPADSVTSGEATQAEAPSQQEQSSEQTESQAQPETDAETAAADAPKPTSPPKPSESKQPQGSSKKATTRSPRASGRPNTGKPNGRNGKTASAKSAEKAEPAGSRDLGELLDDFSNAHPDVLPAPEPEQGSENKAEEAAPADLWGLVGEKLKAYSDGNLSQEDQTMLAQLGSQIKYDDYWYGGKTIPGTEEVYDQEHHESYTMTVERDGKKGSVEVPKDVAKQLMDFAKDHPELVPEPEPAPEPESTAGKQTATADAGSAGERHQTHKDKPGKRQRGEQRPLTGKPENPGTVHPEIWQKLTSAQKWAAADGFDRIPRPESIPEEAWLFMDDAAKWDYSYAAHAKENGIALTKLEASLPDASYWEAPEGTDPRVWKQTAPSLKRRSVNERSGLVPLAKTNAQVKKEKEEKEERDKAAAAAEEAQRREAAVAAKEQQKQDRKAARQLWLGKVATAPQRYTAAARTQLARANEWINTPTGPQAEANAAADADKANANEPDQPAEQTTLAERLEQIRQAQAERERAEQAQAAADIDDKSEDDATDAEEATDTAEAEDKAEAAKVAKRKKLSLRAAQMAVKERAKRANDWLNEK
jgi:hypothetical protein